MIGAVLALAIAYVAVPVGLDAYCRYRNARIGRTANPADSNA